MRLRWQTWGAAWRYFSGKLAPGCAYCDGDRARSRWRRMPRQSRSVLLRGERCCAECLEPALLEVLGRARPVFERAAMATHRIPLGLVLLSRQQLSNAQLRTALEAQRAAGSGQDYGDQSHDSRGGDSQGHGGKKIGAWLQELGFATEQQITAALARQFSCPVLRTAAAPMGASRFPLAFPAIPVSLLESFQMMPVELVAATGTLLIAFGEGIDYTVLLAIEQMLGYRTEACMVCPSILRQTLQALGHRGSKDVVFDRMEDAGECAHIIGSYSARVKAEQIRLAWCGDHLWIRLERLRQTAVTLVLRTGSHRETSSRFSVPNSQ